jgi:hypothetical protein
MENPDTVLELHRTVVEELFAQRLPPSALPPKSFTADPGIAGEAHISVAVSRVWFHVDGSGRRWHRRDGASTSDLDRHLAFDLRLGDHPAELGLADSKLVFTSLGPVPLPAIGTQTCNGRTYGTREIPLFGRLVIHDSLERVDSTIDGQPHQNVVLELSQQQGPALEAGPAPAGSTSEMFGPDVDPQPGGRVLLAGTEPHVVWELTQAEEDCIRQSPVAVLIAGPLIGVDPIDLIAAELAAGVVERLATSGDEGSSTASILPEPRRVDPTGRSSDPLAIDGVVRAWTRDGSSVEEESLQIQLQTIDALPVPLPPSVLELSTDETVGFMRSDFAILRSIRASQIRSLCLEPSDFDPDAGCLLVTDPGVTIGDQDADLVEFEATIVPSAELGHDLIDVKGRAENDSWHSGWYVDFGMQFRLDRGDVPRDPLPGELPPELEPARTLKEMNQRLRELTEEKCAGGDVEAIEEERDAIAAEKLLLPTEVGVKPLVFGEPERDSDFWWTTAGVLFGIALLGATAGFGAGVVAFVGAKFAVAAWMMIGWFLIGAGSAIAGLAVLDQFYYDDKVSDGLRDFIEEKKEQEGEALPLEGYSPTVVLLKDGFLRVFLSPLPEDLSARFFEPDERNPGDLDRTSQQIAGLLDDGRMWQLSIPDAAHLVEKGRVSIAIDAAVSGTGRPVPLLVARSARGRRYLRTPPDDESANDLRDLERIPAP